MKMKGFRVVRKTFYLLTHGNDVRYTYDTHTHAHAFPTHVCTSLHTHTYNPSLKNVHPQHPLPSHFTFEPLFQVAEIVTSKDDDADMMRRKAIIFCSAEPGGETAPRDEGGEMIEMRERQQTFILADSLLRKQPFCRGPNKGKASFLARRTPRGGTKKSRAHTHTHTHTRKKPL